MKDVMGKFGGRKFLLSVVSVVVVGLMNGLDPEMKAQIIAIVSGTYCTGQGLADGLSKGKTSSVK